MYTFTHKVYTLTWTDSTCTGGWGNDTNGLSGVDAGAPAEGDCDGGWQHLEQVCKSAHGENWRSSLIFPVNDVYFCKH